jgi:hypothetical protein
MWASARAGHVPLSAFGARKPRLQTPGRWTLASADSGPVRRIDRPVASGSSDHPRGGVGAPIGVLSLPTHPAIRRARKPPCRWGGFAAQTVTSVRRSAHAHPSSNPARLRRLSLRRALWRRRSGAPGALDPSPRSRPHERQQTRHKPRREPPMQRSARTAEAALCPRTASNASAPELLSVSVAGFFERRQDCGHLREAEGIVR